jgi:hypothetical protein
MENKGILSQTHNVVVEYWGKGGIQKWAEFHALMFLFDMGPQPLIL